MQPAVSVAESRAFMETFTLEPTGAGPLDGLTFAVKDIIDVAGRKTGCGNPTWLETHSAAPAHAVCVEQLLAAGGRCVGKTVSDEMAFSLIGENPHYGTPLNFKAPKRVPGGSSSGSASAVACGLADVSLGSDTGGSVRVPAGNCGIFGLRPSHARISVAGVLPFAPCFDTIGVFARSADHLAAASAILLGGDVPEKPAIKSIHILPEAFDSCMAGTKEALASPLARLRAKYQVHETSIGAIDGQKPGADLRIWFEMYCQIQWTEIWSCLGTWVMDAQPKFGPEGQRNFDLVRNHDRRDVNKAIRWREHVSRRLADLLGPNDLLCLPTSPAPAPLCGAAPRRDEPGGEYYPKALGLTAIAGMGGLPQVSLPRAECDGAPLGLSLLAARGRDEFLLSAVKEIAAQS